ncbi:MAG: DoxX family protein [Propioniciclava sp.]|uniref:DoxX family protein n=1 Tax=Propioniciclava sp. TaxID=2038686 RepID=UPI0039E327CB
MVTDHTLQADPPETTPQRTTPVTPPRAITPPTSDHLPALGLFLVRVVVAAIMAVHGAQKLLNLQGTTGMMTSLGLPQPGLAALALGTVEVLAGAALLFGVLTRLAGLGVLVVMAGALVMVLGWPASMIGYEGYGFAAEFEVLLAALGIMFMFVGAGRWSVDARFARHRASRRAK